MNRIRKDNKGVSPVIATILMVAITVVLAGVLVVYLQTLPSGAGDVQTTIGTRVEKNANGDWLISITSGNKNSVDVTIQVTNPNTGANVFGGKITVAATWGVAAANGVYNDLNVAGKLDAGDSILLRSTTAPAPGPGLCTAGMKVQFLIGDNVIGTIKELPN
jgi:flagellin-like protein